ncbi:hypothetical protein C8Q74DRAFT_1373487 [Fomes fomentarius]|nr:hypothetical protein C8Q74DRAFT_1373487 [Fomes fomentarius]
MFYHRGVFDAIFSVPACLGMTGPIPAGSPFVGVHAKVALLVSYDEGSTAAKMALVVHEWDSNDLIYAGYLDIGWTIYTESGQDARWIIATHEENEPALYAFDFATTQDSLHFRALLTEGLNLAWELVKRHQVALDLYASTICYLPHPEPPPVYVPPPAYSHHVVGTGVRTADHVGSDIHAEEEKQESLPDPADPTIENPLEPTQGRQVGGSDLGYSTWPPFRAWSVGKEDAYAEGNQPSLFDTTSAAFSKPIWTGFGDANTKEGMQSLLLLSDTFHPLDKDIDHSRISAADGMFKWRDGSLGLNEALPASSGSQCSSLGAAPTTTWILPAEESPYRTLAWKGCDEDDNMQGSQVSLPSSDSSLPLHSYVRTPAWTLPANGPPNPTSAWSGFEDDDMEGDEPSPPDFDSRPTRPATPMSGLADVDDDMHSDEEWKGCDEDDNMQGSQVSLPSSDSSLPLHSYVRTPAWTLPANGPPNPTSAWSGFEDDDMEGDEPSPPDFDSRPTRPATPMSGLADVDDDMHSDEEWKGCDEDDNMQGSQVSLPSSDSSLPLHSYVRTPAWTLPANGPPNPTSAWSGFEDDDMEGDESSPPGSGRRCTRRRPAVAQTPPRQARWEEDNMGEDKVSLPAPGPGLDCSPFATPQATRDYPSAVSQMSVWKGLNEHDCMWGDEALLPASAWLPSSSVNNVAPTCMLSVDAAASRPVWNGSDDDMDDSEARLPTYETTPASFPTIGAMPVSGATEAQTSSNYASKPVWMEVQDHDMEANVDFPFAKTAASGSSTELPTWKGCQEDIVMEGGEAPADKPSTISIHPWVTGQADVAMGLQPPFIPHAVDESSSFVTGSSVYPGQRMDSWQVPRRTTTAPTYSDVEGLDRTARSTSIPRWTEDGQGYNNGYVDDPRSQSTMFASYEETAMNCDSADAEELRWSKIMERMANQIPNAPATKCDIQMLTYLFNELRLQWLQRLRETAASQEGIARTRSYAVQHRGESELNLKWQIRRFCMYLMKRRTKKSSIVSAPDVEVSRFNKGRGEGPTIAQFSVTLKNPPRCLWNERAADVFAEALVKSGWTRCSDGDKIKAMFFVHLQTLRVQYERQYHDAEGQQGDADRDQTARRAARRRGTRNRRAEACRLHPDLARFKTLWDQLSWEACSGDESGAEGRGTSYHTATKLDWRASEVDNWVIPFDTIHLLGRYKGDGKPKRGNFPHERRHGSSRVDRHNEPVRGLPLNFYSEDFLERIGPQNRKALSIQPPVDLSHTRTIQDIARRFRGLSGRVSQLPYPNPLLVPIRPQRVQPRRKNVVNSTLPSSVLEAGEPAGRQATAQSSNGRDTRSNRERRTTGHLRREDVNRPGPSHHPPEIHLQLPMQDVVRPQDFEPPTVIGQATVEIRLQNTSI